MRRAGFALFILFAVAGGLPPQTAAAQNLGTAVAGISFLEPIDFATGAVPSSVAFNAVDGDQNGGRANLSDSVAVGDFNHDGRSDVAQTNVIAGSVAVFLGDGVGGFASPQANPVGANPNFVVTGDLDLDGNPDLAVADTGSNDVAILYGVGDGTFHRASFIPVPGPRNVAIGRFNADEVPDLAVASAAGVAILTRSSAEDGIFVLRQFVPLTANDRPVSPNYVAAGDLDGAGLDDLAVAVGASPSAGDKQSGDTKLTGDDVLVFLNRNQAAGTIPDQPFAATSSQPAIRVGGSPGAIVVADLNGDAGQDLGVVSGSGDLTTLLGDGNGHFDVHATNITVGAIPRAAAAGDFNDDGTVDVVTANFFASTVSVLQGNGDGTFRPAVDFWSGDATTGVAVGHFNGDRRLDVVAGRLRNDNLALLLNDSPHPGDRVAIRRDIPFGSPTHPTDDPFAAHHTLDVYSPPLGTASFAGTGTPYPVVLFVHGGAGVAGDKSVVSYLMRSLAREGIVAISTNYRLGPPTMLEAQVQDIAQAFRWVRQNVSASDYRGDPDNIFVLGHSHGALLVGNLVTEPDWLAEQEHIRGLVLAGLVGPVAQPTSTQPRSLLLNGNEGTEIAVGALAASFSAASVARGAESRHVTVQGRDHFTLVSDMALAGDPGRLEVLQFMRDD